MNESFMPLRADYEVVVTELNALAETAWNEHETIESSFSQYSKK